MSKVFFSIAVLLRKYFKFNFFLHTHSTRSAHLLLFLALRIFMSVYFKTPLWLCIFLSFLT